MKDRKEKRRFERFDMPCPITLAASGGVSEIRGRTLNVSDGGACFVLAEGQLPEPGGQFRMKLALPRQTPNTYFLEHFTGPAAVVWMDEGTGAAGRQPRIGIRFVPHLPLDIQ